MFYNTVYYVEEGSEYDSNNGNTKGDNSEAIFFFDGSDVLIYFAETNQALLAVKE